MPYLNRIADADASHVLHSIADTAGKNGQCPLDAFLALV